MGACNVVRARWSGQRRGGNEELDEHVDGWGRWRAWGREGWGAVKAGGGNDGKRGAG